MEPPSSIVTERPIRAEIHRCMFGLFVTVIRDRGSLEREVIKRQQAIKDMDSNSCVVQIRATFHMQVTTPARFLSLSENPPNKRAWKMETTRTVIKQYCEFRHLSKRLPKKIYQ